MVTFSRKSMPKPFVVIDTVICLNKILQNIFKKYLKNMHRGEWGLLDSWEVWATSINQNLAVDNSKSPNVILVNIGNTA